MKTLFITISDGEVSKNILYTDVFRRLAEHYRLVLFVNPRKVEYFAKSFGSERVAIEAMPAPSSAVMEEFFADLFLYSLHTQSILVKIEYSYRSGGSSIGKVIKLLLWTLGALYPYRVLGRLFYRLVPDHSFDQYFTHYKPALVFAANLTSMEDARILAAARRFRVKSVGLPKGWDNLTLKTFLPVFPDELLVQTMLMKDDAVRLDYPVTRIRVVGFPKFDVYAQWEKLSSRQDFMQRLGLDPNRKLILYAGAGDQLAPHDEEILAEFLQAVEDGEIPGSPQVLVRPHPKYKYRTDTLPPRDFWKLDRPGKAASAGVSFEFGEDEVVHLMNSLYHCDLLIHTVSTLGIEAAIFDRPSITIAYDGAASPPQGLSVARYYQYEHMARVLKAGGMKMARNFDELVRLTTECLDNSAHDSAARSRMVAENTYKVGTAGERVADEIIHMAETVTD